MIWYRMQVGFVTHPRMLQLTAQQRWDWMIILDHCAQHDSEGELHKLTLKRLHITPRVIAKFQETGLLHTTDENTYTVHNWQRHNGKDHTAAERQARHRDTQDTAIIDTGDHVFEQKTFTTEAQLTTNRERNLDETEQDEANGEAKNPEMSRVTHVRAQTETVQNKEPTPPKPSPTPNGDNRDGTGLDTISDEVARAFGGLGRGRGQKW